MGSWMNKDGLYLQYGTTKAVPETAGEYLTENEGSRVLECYVDMTTLTSTPLIISNTVLWPATPTGKSDKFFIEAVEVVALVGCTGGSGVNVGVINADRTTAMASTGASAFVNNLLVANIATAGNKVILTKGGTVTGAGTYVPTPGNNAVEGYITASVGTGDTYSAGQLRVRIKYYEYGTIYQ
jgi:hypothetical protein